MHLLYFRPLRGSKINHSSKIKGEKVISHLLSFQPVSQKNKNIVFFFFLKVMHHVFLLQNYFKRKKKKSFSSRIGMRLLFIDFNFWPTALFLADPSFLAKIGFWKWIQSPYQSSDFFGTSCATDHQACFVLFKRINFWKKYVYRTS